MNNPLDKIIEYGMNPIEAKAYKVSLLWIILSKKALPDYQHVKLRKTGDPRKSLLFKYCFKLVTETKGLIEDRDYKLYIQAQLDVLKSITDGTVHALVDPSCLVGDKAWRRWKMWKWKFDRNESKYEQTSGGSIKINLSLVSADLKNSKKFLDEKLPNYTKIEIKDALRDRVMVGWITLGKVSPYYVMLSPYVKEALGGREFDETFSFNLGSYKDMLDEDVEKIFKEIFQKEFAPQPPATH